MYGEYMRREFTRRHTSKSAQKRHDLDTKTLRYRPFQELVLAD